MLHDVIVRIFVLEALTCQEKAALDRQDLSCTHLVHHELESNNLYFQHQPISWSWVTDCAFSAQFSKSWLSVLMHQPLTRAGLDLHSLQHSHHVRCTNVAHVIAQCPHLVVVNMQAEDAATDMGGQATKAVAAAEAVLQEASTAVAKQLQRAIPEAQNLFLEEDVGPSGSAPDGHMFQIEGSAQPSDSQDSDAEVCYLFHLAGHRS